MKNLSNTNVKAKGFTLIELVVVIVILGILAATAAPKFIDLTSDAKASVLQGALGSVESAVSMIHAKALVKNKASNDDVVEVNGVFYAVTNGYPRALSIGDKSGDSAANAVGILGAIDINDDADGDFETTDAAITIIEHRGATDGATCRITYPASAGAGIRPDATILTVGC